MITTSSRENILSKIRTALQESTPKPFANITENTNHFVASTEELTIEFANNFTGLLGKFSYCANKDELIEQLKTLALARNFTEIYCVEKEILSLLKQNNFEDKLTNNLSTCQASITTCQNLVARTGSIVLTSNIEEGRTASVYAPIHICIAYANQLVFDVADVITNVQTQYQKALPSVIAFATGPSRTADIEKTLVVGVHGPKEVYCFLVEK